MSTATSSTDPRATRTSLAWAMGGIGVPAVADLPWLVGLAAAATLAHWLLAKALGEADASMIIVVDFTKLPWVTLGAFVFFGEALQYHRQAN